MVYFDINENKLKENARTAIDVSLHVSLSLSSSRVTDTSDPIHFGP